MTHPRLSASEVWALFSFLAASVPTEFLALCLAWGPEHGRDSWILLSVCASPKPFGYKWAAMKPIKEGPKTFFQVVVCLLLGLI